MHDRVQHGFQWLAPLCKVASLQYKETGEAIAMVQFINGGILLAPPSQGIF